MAFIKQNTNGFRPKHTAMVFFNCFLNFKGGHFWNFSKFKDIFYTEYKV